MVEQDEKNICPKISYCMTADEKGAILTGCYGMDGCIYLPDMVDGLPIVGIAPYGFSDNTGRKLPGHEYVWESPYVSFLTEEKRLMKEDITEVYLPRYLQDVGRYAFYRCKNLRKLSLHNDVLEIGGGALNGCISLREIDLYLHEKNAQMSALKSIAGEVRYQLYIRFFTKEEKVELLFPEHYEEAVENTPARILYTSHHGSGGYYRQCFTDRALDYKKYDALLPFAIAEEEEADTVRLSLLRLRYPKELGSAAREAYLACVKKNLKAAFPFFVDKEDIETFLFLSKEGLLTEELLLYGADLAQEAKKTELLSFFMDERFKLFPKKKKKFSL